MKFAKLATGASAFNGKPSSVNGVVSASFSTSDRRHWLVLPDRQLAQTRHSAIGPPATWSPTFRLLTPGPHSTTTPAASCPRMIGNAQIGMAQT